MVPPENWTIRLLARDEGEDEIAVNGFVATGAELRRFLGKLKRMMRFLPAESTERTLPIMPRQRGGLTRAPQKQSERTGA